MNKSMKFFDLIVIISIVILHEFAIVEDSFESELGYLLLSSSSMTSRLMQIFILITILGLALSILIMVTSFVHISIIALSIVRTFLSLKQSPPNQVLISLVLFLTFFIMSPMLQASDDKGLEPMIQESIKEEEAFLFIAQPFKKIMISNDHTKDLDLFISIFKIGAPKTIENLPLRVIISAFIISELKRSFKIDFSIFLPFLIIDIVVAPILIVMGIMMSSAMVASLFKIISFVLADGCYLPTGSLVQSFVT